MKSLRQILQKKSIWPFHATPTNNQHLEKEIHAAVKEWLTERRQEDQWSSFIDEDDRRQVQAVQRFVDSLLSEETFESKTATDAKP